MSSKKSSKTKFEGQRRKMRHFSEAFKKEKVQLILERKVTIAQISELYKVSRTAVYNWVYKYSHIERQVITVVQMESEEQKTKMLLNRVAELERIIGQKQLEIDLNEQVFEVLKEELGYDVKKKYEQRLSKDSV
ncbi:MAG TPA: transposase [Gammaproteobacteria bacterium]|nr:transposase [Gammaproteobacteria bacterium]